MAIEDIKFQIKSYPISQVIGNYLSLTRKGRTLQALCPFHADSNPSLSVSDDKGLFRCFVCNVGGDAISFVEKYKNLSFLESLAECAQILGLDSTELEKKSKVQDPRQEMASRTLEAALKVYRKFAMETAPIEFTKFLTERGLTEEIAQTFGLGYSGSQNYFIQYLKSLPDQWKQSSLEMAKELGLIGQSSRGFEFEYFSERIIFPIWDLQGNPVGIGSRATQENQKGKYINSKESFFFHKKHLLYGYHLARPSFREKDRVILVEGYMDVISLYRFGFKESLAVMGTSPPSERNIKLLKSQVKDIYLALDSDTSGLRAMERFLPLFLNESILPKFLDFSPHKDADEFLRAQGSFELEKRIETAPYLVDRLIENIVAEITITDGSEKKIAALEKIFALLAPLKEDLRALERIHLAAKRLSLSMTRESIERSYQGHLKGQKGYRAPKGAPLSLPPSTEGSTQSTEEPTKSAELATLDQENSSIKSKATVHFPLTKSAQILLREVLRHPDLVERSEITELLDFIGHSELRRVFGLIKRLLWEVSPEALSTTLLNLISAEEGLQDIRELVGAVAFEGVLRPLDEKTREKLIADLNIKVREEALVEKRKSLALFPGSNKESLSTLSSAHLPASDLDSLLAEISRLDKEINQLRRSKRPVGL